MKNPPILRLVTVLAIVAFVFTSCSEEEISMDENQAFSSNSNPTTNFSFDLSNGKGSWSDYTLVVRADNAVKQAWIEVNGTTIPLPHVKDRLKSCFGNSGNVPKSETLINAFAVGNQVIVAQRDSYVVFNIDQGEYLKAANNTLNTYCKSLDEGLSLAFYHDFKRADFPRNFLAVKDGELYTSSSINGTFEPVSVRGVNSPIIGVAGYTFSSTKKLITLITENGNVKVEKERRQGVNIYKK